MPNIDDFAERTEYYEALNQHFATAYELDQEN